MLRNIIGLIFTYIAYAILAILLYLIIRDVDVSQVTGALWFSFDRFSLNNFQVFIERKISLPSLWTAGIVPYILMVSFYKVSIFTIVITYVIGRILRRKKNKIRNRRLFQ